MGNEDRAADSDAKLIAMKLGFRQTGLIEEVIVRIECIVAQKFPGIAVELVGTRLHCGVQHGAGSSTEFRVVVVRLNLEFGESIHRRLNDVVFAILSGDDGGIIVDPIQQIVVLGRADNLGGKSAGWVL
jgi:hypothetical protein